MNQGYNPSYDAYPVYPQQGYIGPDVPGNTYPQNSYIPQQEPIQKEIYMNQASQRYMQPDGYVQDPMYMQQSGYQDGMRQEQSMNEGMDETMPDGTGQSGMNQNLPPLYLDKTNLQYASEYDYLNPEEMTFSFRKMKDWNGQTNLGFVLDGILVSYLGAVVLYFAIYFWMNGGPVPRDGWNDLYAFAVCLVFIAVSSVIYSVLKIRNKVESYTVGTIYRKEITDRTQEQIWKKGTALLWVYLYGSQMTIPVQVKKDVWKNYRENERVIVYAREKSNVMRILHLFSYKQRQKQQLMMEQNARSGYRTT